MKIGYFDCIAGASGDMILGALLDAGLPLESLKGELKKLPLKDYKIKAALSKRGFIGGTRVIVECSKMTGAGYSLKEITAVISASTLSDHIKTRSIDIFRNLAKAESKVHRTKLEEMHFHEVGAVDAIVDITGACIGFELLGLEKIYSSPLPTGSGTVDTGHGLLPVPAPATVELLAMAKAPLRVDLTPGLGELVTPTGAAILTTLASFEQPVFRLERAGYGVGSRFLAKLPNVLRLCIGEMAESASKLLLLETNIDNMSAEILGYVLERLFDQGARDAWFTPIQMKKNRPATMLSVIIPFELEQKVVGEIFSQTSTFGIRIREIQRHEADRKLITFDSSLGKVTVKIKILDGVTIGIAPEYEDCRRLSIEHGIPLQDVYRIIASEAAGKLT